MSRGRRQLQVVQEPRGGSCHVTTILVVVAVATAIALYNTLRGTDLSNTPGIICIEAYVTHIILIVN